MNLRIDFASGSDDAEAPVDKSACPPFEFPPGSALDVACYGRSGRRRLQPPLRAQAADPQPAGRSRSAGGYRMPTDAKFGLLVGVGLTLAVAVVFFGKVPTASPWPQRVPPLTPSAAGTTPPPARPQPLDPEPLSAQPASLTPAPPPAALRPLPAGTDWRPMPQP